MGMASVYQVSATVFQDFTEQIVLKVSFSLYLPITTACVCDLQCLLASLGLSYIQIEQFASFILRSQDKYDQEEVLPHFQ